MSDHEHDEDGNCIVPRDDLYPNGIPTWRFSTWDIVGIAATTAGGLFTVLGQGLNLFAREAAAMANYSRRDYELRQAQREYDEAQAANAAALDHLLNSTTSEQS